MLDIIQQRKGKIILLIVIGIAAAFVIYRLMPPSPTEVSTLQSTPTPYPEQTWEMNESLTIGDFTVDLLEIKDTADGLRVSRSHQTNVSELDYLPIGSPEIQYADGSIEDAHGGRLPGLGEDMNLSLGAFIVADTSLSGSVDIPLASLSENGTLSPQPELLIGDRSYAVTELAFMDERLRITLQPRNETAERSILGTAAGAPAEAILTDETGKVYRDHFAGMSFDAFNHTLDRQEFVFDGVQRERLSSTTTLTLTIRGGGNIVGPFVFGNIALVSEDIPPVTPVPPGGVGPGDPIPTPPNANN